MKKCYQRPCDVTAEDDGLLTFLNAFLFQGQTEALEQKFKKRFLKKQLNLRSELMR